MASDLVIYETMPGSAPTLTRPLTHHLELADRGLAVNATQNEEWRPVPGHEGRESAIRIAVDDALSDAMSELIDSGFSFDDVRDALALVDLVDLWDQERDS